MESRSINAGSAKSVRYITARDVVRGAVQPSVRQKFPNHIGHRLRPEWRWNITPPHIQENLLCSDHSAPSDPAHRARSFPQVRSHRIAVRRGRGLVHRFTLGSVQRIRRVVIPSGRSIRLCDRIACRCPLSTVVAGASAFAEMFAVAVLACEHRTASGSTCVR